MVGPGFGHYNFQELISNSIQLLCKNLKRHHSRPRPDGSPLEGDLFSLHVLLLIC